MANTLLTPDVLARAALANLYEQLCMVPLVYTDVSSDFTRTKVGETVNIRKPATFTANTFDRSSGITIQNATETSVPVVLNTIKDVSFAVTSEDLTLHLEDFTEQLLKPAMEALAQSIDRAIIAQAKADFTQVAGTQTGFEWNKPEVLIEARRQLDIKNVPNSECAAVVGPTTKANWLNSDWLKHADKSGSTEALRKGSIGTDLLSFDAFMTQNIVQPAGSPATGQPTTEVGLAFHRTALALASAPLALPSDQGWAAVESYKGLSLRLVKRYDIVKKQDVCSLDILFGTKTLDANRGVLLRGALAA
ncbi:P22 phage major capsid protein family protein [Nocardia xishanensis]|uniref:P22 phage major capsid protein family protein n=1 Tax=Nocardia xishanensis TaxID=238964 RepID=UPI00082A627F|nr:P22 phage major capsid protein family protein [Nocardia xishanensis]